MQTLFNPKVAPVIQLSRRVNKIVDISLLAIYHITIMKFEITHDKSTDMWTSPTGGVELCDKILSQLGVDSNHTHTMTLRTKNPRKKGFIKVELQHRYGFWIWAIPSIKLNMESHHRFFSNVVDFYLNRMFPHHHNDSYEISVVWVKFEKV